MNKKSIFITGGNSGIGLATALLFAREGFNVAIVGRRADRNAAALAEIKAVGAEALAFAGDVTDEAFLRQSIAETASAFGGLHYAFNNAGIEQIPKPLAEQTVEEYRQIFDINVLGVWMSMREEIPVIQRSGGGAIVNTSSIAGHIGMAQVDLYIASKHAVLGLTKCAALEFAKSGVRVNAVSPGGVRTDMLGRFTGGSPEGEAYMASLHPMGRIGTPEEIASAVLWLCRDATFTTGQSLLLDGGFTTP